MLGPSEGGATGNLVSVQEDADLVYLANHVAAAELAAFDHVTAPLLTLYSRHLQGTAATLSETRLNGTLYAESFNIEGHSPWCKRLCATWMPRGRRWKLPEC